MRETVKKGEPVYDEEGNPQGVDRSKMRWNKSHPNNNPRWWSDETTIGWRPQCHCYGKPRKEKVECRKCRGTGRKLALVKPLEWQKSCGSDSQGGYKGKALKGYETAGAQNASDLKRSILEGIEEKGIELGGEVRETGQPCRKCKGVGKVEKDVWDDEVLAIWKTRPQLVIDPFGGSGTTALAAVELGRGSVSLDLSFEYCLMAKRRIDGANRPLPLEQEL